MDGPRSPLVREKCPLSRVTTWGQDLFDYHCELDSVQLGLGVSFETSVEFTDHSSGSSLRGRHPAVEEGKVLAFLPPD